MSPSVFGMLSHPLQMGASPISENWLSKIQIISGGAMFSFLVGGGVGFWVQRAKVGMALVLLYSVVAGVVLANISYREAAAVMPLLLAVLGFGIGRLVLRLRNRRKFMLKNAPLASTRNLGSGPIKSLVGTASR
jgi:hypothetical protein